MTWLAQVQLPLAADRTLHRLERLYRAVHVDAQAADREVRERAKADPIAARLDDLVGVGPVMALTVRAEIGDVARFRSGPALASYAGLVPRVDSSAGRVYHGRITRQGSPWLRWALVQAARHASRFRRYGVLARDLGLVPSIATTANPVRGQIQDRRL